MVSRTSDWRDELGEIAPELTGHGLPLGKCEAYNRVYDQFYQSRPLQSCGPSTGTVQEANRSAPATGRRIGVQDQGGHRRTGEPTAIGGSTPFSSGKRWLQV